MTENIESNVEELEYDPLSDIQSAAWRELVGEIAIKAERLGKGSIPAMPV